MTTIRRRKPKFEFVQLLNAVVRDYRVSWRARGLLAELLSYPADYEISVDELVKKAKRQEGGNVEGREAMRTAARELKAVGYIIEERHQDERGKWRTELEVTDDPMYDLLLTSQNVSPGQSDAQKSGVGYPGVGSPGVSPNTETNTETNTSPPAPPSDERPARHSGDGAGREDETPSNNETETPRAEALVTDAVRRWGSGHRAPGARDRQRLAERVAAELDAGGDETVVLDELTRDLGDARSAVSVVLGARTATPGWGRSSDPRPDHSRHEPTGPKPVWCGVCDERTRLVAALGTDGSERMRRCQCHPESTPIAHDRDEPEGDPEPAPDPATLDRMRASLTGEGSGDEEGDRLTPAARAAADSVRQLLAEQQQQ